MSNFIYEENNFLYFCMKEVLSLAITGGIIVVLAFAAIIKKYETRMVLLAAGFLMCFIGGVGSNAVAAFSKTMVHTSLVPVICTVMGFSYVMKLTTCDRHLVESISGLITRSRFILIPLATLLTWWINIAIPSAAGCSAAVGSILIPTLMAAGVHPAMAAAAVLAGTWGSAISPGQAHNIFVADLAQTDLMTVIMAQVPAAVISSIVAVITLTVIAVLRKEGPDSARRSAYLAELEKEEGGTNFKVNPIYAIVPLVPLILLVLGSKQLAVLPLVDVPTAMIAGTVLALIVTRQNPQEITKKFFSGMGDAYGDVIGLIVAAAVFTAGMSAMGLTDALIDAMKGSESVARLAGAFGPFLIAVISGSGDAAALAFNGAITPQADAFGMRIIDLGSLAQMAGSIGRSMSPVAGAALVCAGLARVSPMELTKRNALPMLLATITFMIVLFL